MIDVQRSVRCYIWKLVINIGDTIQFDINPLVPGVY